ncbi:response regulator [Desulfovibrio sp. UCD-KL4C]|uniref:response regulator n=1 Tax=Desulfovibrio sp. UCD-KL4C TaxID=2578120 RepID=UPI0025BD1493|nr:response regulator [Desulfovibrio sp. UCD-KL4C]
MRRTLYYILFALSLIATFSAGILYNYNPVVSFVCLSGVIIVLILIISGVRRDMERNALENQEFYSTIINNSDIGLYRADLNGKCVYANDFFKTLVKDLPNLYKNGDQSIVVPLCEDSLKHNIFFKNLLDGGKILESESCFLTDDGKNLHLAETAKIVCDVDGKAIGIVGAVKNISAVKVIEEKLELEKRYLTAVMDILSEAVFIEDLEGTYLKVSRSFADYTGLDTPELCVGSNANNYFSPRISSVILDNISNVATTGEDSNFVLPVEDRHGRKVEFSVKHSLIRNHKGEPTAIIGYAREFKEIEVNRVDDVWKSLNKSLDVSYSLNNLCHELRTPFVGIIGSIKAFAEEELPDRAKSYAEKALKSAERFKDALNYFLHDFSSEDSSDKELPFFNSNIAFSKILDMYIPAVELENRSIEFFIENKIPKNISGSRRQFLQAIFCLVGNGVSILQGTKLVAGIEALDLTEHDAEFNFFVRDCSNKGVRPHPSQLSYVFIETVRKLGGDLYCNADNGFTIGFKVRAGFNLEKTGVADNCADDAKKCVLLAEDDISSQFMMRKKLEKKGCIVRTAATGLEVLNCLKESTYDLVLMDVQMPEMNGFEATKTIRAEEDGEVKIPIVVMSAYDADIDTKQMSLLGINEFVSKPIRNETLEKIINKYLS